jgi:hypothetical protein
MPRVKSKWQKMKYKKCNILSVFAVVRPANVAVVIVTTAATTVVF